MGYSEILVPRFDLVDLALEAELFAQAKRASKLAYIPHSGFPVGAAIIDKRNGTIITGSNFESDSYGLTNCAERVTIQKAVSSGVRELGTLAVTCPEGNPEDPNSNMCCGACRQVISEHLDPDEVVCIEGVGQFYVGHILPMPFRLPAGA